MRTWINGSLWYNGNVKATANQNRVESDLVHVCVCVISVEYDFISTVYVVSRSVGNAMLTNLVE